MFFNKDKTVKIKFVFNSIEENRKRVTWDDLNTLESISSGGASSRDIMLFAARFMADEKGQYLPHEKGVKILGGLNGDDIADVLKQFTEALSESTVPKVNGGVSNSPSAVGQVEMPPPGQPL